MKACRYWSLILICLLTLLPWIDRSSSAQSPYPPSPVIAGIEWNYNDTCRGAQGSDLWPVTWAADDNLYTSWGDGGGFNGSDAIGRVSLGFARISGSPTQCTGVNIWGGANQQYPATFTGKTAGILAVDGTLYAWINLQDDEPANFALAWSEDQARSWQLAPWQWSSREFTPSTILNFGRNYAGARDEYLYFYGGTWGYSQDIYLTRVHKDRVRDRSAYEFFRGLSSDQQPQWTTAIEQRRPVFTDPNLANVGNGPFLASVIYNFGIQRYLLTVPHGGLEKLGIFDAPEPWGPWTTVTYEENWAGAPFDLLSFVAWLSGDGSTAESLMYVFPTKWISSDGTQLTMVFSGTHVYDSYNAISARLVLR